MNPHRPHALYLAGAAALPRGVERAASAAWPALVAGGCLALAVGVLVYALDRAGAHAGPLFALPALAGPGAGPWLGAVGGWLPSFVHRFAFSLFAAALRPAGAAPAYEACGA